MQKNEKSKKKTIEKLCMILDDPYSKDASIKDEKYLDALRKRLVKPYRENFAYLYRISGSKNDSLKADVTIHKRELGTPVTPELKEVKSEEQKTENPFEDEELYEVEKIEFYLPEFVEVKPDEEAIEEEKPLKSLESKKTIVATPLKEGVDQGLPEWEPVDTKETRVKEEKSEHEKEISEWEPVSSKETEEEIKDKTITEKHKEKTADTKKYDRLDVFKEISSIDKKTADLLYENGITSTNDLRKTSIKELTKIRGIRKNLAKKIKKEVDKVPKKAYVKEELHIIDTGTPVVNIEEKYTTEPGLSFNKDKIAEQRPEGIKTYRYRNYTLYRKEIKIGHNKKRTIHFFSRTEPEDGKSVDLPDGYEVKVNKKTGVPYIRKKR